MDDKIREAWTVARQTALAAQPQNLAAAFGPLQAISMLDDYFNAPVVEQRDEDAQTG